jgi:hypothetical protein
MACTRIRGFPDSEIHSSASDRKANRATTLSLSITSKASLCSLACS